MDRDTGSQEIRVGAKMRVRSLDAILATLDEDASLGGMPFMAEMAQYAGKTLTVDAVVNRTCDTIGNSGTTRGMRNTVHLQGARCDGSAHGGCQASCLLYWRTEWLEPAVEEADTASVETVPQSIVESSHSDSSESGEPAYRCQATEVVRASCFASPYDPSYWIRDLRAGNATPGQAAASAAVVALNKWQKLSTKWPTAGRIHDGRAWPWYVPTGERSRYEPQGLKPGDLVRIRSKEEIEATLDDKDCVRGLRFSAEMLPHCGKQARVLASLERIIDERSGRMIKLRDCYVLEDIWCEGTFRLMCHRKIYAYWRETWLERLPPPEGAA